MLSSTNSAVIADEPFYNLHYHAVRSLRHVASSVSDLRTVAILNWTTVAIWTINHVPSALS